MRQRQGIALLEVCGGLCAAVLGWLVLRVAADTLVHEQTPKTETPSPGPPRARALLDHDDERALRQHPEPIASYDIVAKLDANSHVIDGHATIVWRNSTQKPADELWLHLYLNAFKNEKTLFLRSPYGAGRSGDRARDWGYLDVKQLRARELGGRDLWPGAASHSPGDPDDQTDIRVPLPAPVEPGRVLTLDVKFTAKLPQIVERTGYSGSYHFVAQWFPKLAKIDADGSWVHFPYHGQSEFYADFGQYRVTLDVPESMLVGATGRRTSERVSRGRRIVQHEANDVHDFAWTAWDGFREQSERIPGTAVRVELLYPASHEANAKRTFEALRFGIPHYERRYGPYPYPTLTVVHPPEHARNSGGMEYPTLITTGGAWYFSRLGIRAVEGVTIHELGHQWFYGLIASNEHTWPFLDEGLNSYAEGEALEAAYGSGSLIDLPWFELSTESVRRAFAAIRAQDDNIASPAAHFASFDALGSLVYSRTAILLQTLANVYGQDALADALGRYARRYRFLHPGPAEFTQAIGEVLGEAARATVEAALFERGSVDYLIRNLASARVSRPAGVFDRAGGRETVVRDNVPESERWVGRVVVYRHGSLTFPVDIELLAEDGTRQRRRWDGRGTWTALDYEGKSRLVSATVDPEFRILLDDNLLNNAASTRRADSPRVLERVTYVSELLLAVLGP